ncbi:MAG: hypothetical protein QW078_04575 [Thermoplasmatales archaeon]
MSIDVRTLDQDTSFKVRMQAYLYIDALYILNKGKGDRLKLEDYMEKRIKAIEQLLNVSRPFTIVEGDNVILEVK